MTEILEILERLNPWWTGKNFESGIFRDRYLENINSFLKTGEIIVLTGVRRSGKTTLIYQTIKHLIDNKTEGKQILFVNFDNADISVLKSSIKTVLDTFFNEIADKNKKCYIFFDEVQSISEWEKWAKTIYDEKKHNLIISGSSSYLLSSNLAKLLSGRYLKINVFPLSFKEYLIFNNSEQKVNLCLQAEDKALALSFRSASPKLQQTHTFGHGYKTEGFGDFVINDKINLISKKGEIIKLLKSFLKEGGYPKVVLEKEARLKEETLKSYFESIVLKDIVLMNNVRQEKLMKELIYYLSSNFTELYSYKNLSEFLSADFSTIKEYLGYIEKSNLFFPLSIFSYSLKVQSRNNKKIYFIDNGLRNAISFKFSEDYGKLAENLVFLEIMQQNEQVYYWQNDSNEEIDFIIKNKDNSLTAINVTYSDEIDKKEFNIFKEFKEKYRNTKKFIILSKSIEKIEEGIEIIPLWKWLLKKENE